LGEAPRRETSDTWVRLSVSKARFQAARADFARELTFRGATLSMIPPQLGPPAGALAVVSVATSSPAKAAGLREGDLMLELQGIATPTFSALEQAQATLVQQAVSVKIDAQGMTRSLRVGP
jgi:S1-C subfamily serine protease